MKEVSCRFFDVLLRDLRERGVAAERLLEGTGYTVAHLADKNERVDYSAFVRMMENARALWTHDELIRLGERSTEGPLVRFIGVVARIRFSVTGFYQWVLGPNGPASQMITCAASSVHVTGPGELTVRFQMAEGYAPNEVLFTVTQGTYAAMPRMIGAAPAKVTLTMHPDGGTFAIRYTESRGVLPAVRKFVSAPFTMKAAAAELTDAHTSLLRRYEELDASRAQVERQRQTLDIAYQLGQQIWGEGDVSKIAKAVADTLLARPGIVGLELAAEGVKYEHGMRTGEAAATVDRLAIWCKGEHADAKQLLELVAPTIALAIDNAVYQTGLEKLVDERTAELREAQASREKFFGNISHEIRTPLSLIMLAARDIQARAGAQLDDRSSAGLVSITEGARKLLRLVDELLLLAAGQADKLVLAPEPMDLVALATQIAAAWRPAAEAGGLSFSAELPSALTINADPVAIERVISNLVSNAVKYTPVGGSVRLVVETSADGPAIRVVDTGRGIDADLASRLFGRFERAAGDDRKKSGTGIGLALVKQLIDGHGGTVAAIPRSPGTEFSVRLPASIVIENMRVADTRLRTTHAPTAAPVLASGQMFAPTGVSKGTILVAEDDSRLADSVARLLSDHYTVVVALNGLDALEQVGRYQPQLLITDVDMPGMTGIELAAKFREVTGDKLSPIIILSAVVDLNTRVAGLEAGAIDYVGKPFEPKELLARVEAQFRMREMAMRLHRAEQLSTLGILTSGLAHELRNPANGIVNAIEPLRECLPAELLVPESAVGELLDVMKSSADQMQFLVNQLLGFRSNSELALRSVVLADLVNRAVRLANGSLTGIDVRVSLDRTGSIMCAPPLMVQVLTNLIENAGHAAGKGGWVQVRSAEQGGRVAIEVTDSGPGVPSALRERIFEPFFTTKDPKPGAGGTGLGLSVARTIIHRHRGTLELRQSAGKSAFVIELPHVSNLASPKGGI